MKGTNATSVPHGLQLSLSCRDHWFVSFGSCLLLKRHFRQTIIGGNVARHTLCFGADEKRTSIRTKSHGKIWPYRETYGHRRIREIISITDNSLMYPAWTINWSLCNAVAILNRSFGVVAYSL